MQFGALRLNAPQRETKVIGLICTGHFISHFYLLVVPPLFPVLRDIYGVGFTELGLATAGFSMASGLSEGWSTGSHLPRLPALGSSQSRARGCP